MPSKIEIVSTNEYPQTCACYELSLQLSMVSFHKIAQTPIFFLFGRLFDDEFGKLNSCMFNYMDFGYRMQ